MKKNLVVNFFAGLFSLVFLLSACDKLEEDTKPILTSKLTLKNDYYTTTVNQAIQLQVLANDTITNQATINFGMPLHGKIQATGTPGTVFYQPDQNFIGTDSVTYQVCVAGNCISALVKIDVLSNIPCTVSVSDDTITVYQNQTTGINILQNDVACNKMPQIVQPAQHGQASINSNKQLNYTPATGFTGTDEVYYAIGSATAKVSITVKPAQGTCILKANPDVVTMRHIASYDSVVVNVLANDTWCPTPAASINLVSQSMYGSVQILNYPTGQKILYSTSTTQHNITDQFQYRLCQGGNCSTTTVTVNIQ